MIRRLLPALLLLSALAPALRAQFQLLEVDAGGEHAVPPVYDLGTVLPGEPATVRFRIRNLSVSRATLTLLTVSGTGFTLATGPGLPVALLPQASVDFTVGFLAVGGGTYSAPLQSDGIAVLLIATVPARLTCEADAGAGFQPLGPAGVDFGSVELGSTAVRHFLLLNQQPVALAVPAVAVQGADFSIAGAGPSGGVLQPGQSYAFDVRLAPTASGARTGSLAVGDHAYPLTGIGVQPPLPQPTLAVALGHAESAQQGTVAVNLGSPSKAGGSGTVTLDFLPAAPLPPGTADPAIAFAEGGRTATFTVAPGDTQGHFGTGLSVPFQTGTTAGTLVFTVQLGGSTDRQTIAVAPAPVGVTAVQGVRPAGAVEIDVTGFDNTRTAGAVTFTFFDAAGNPIAPGALRADATQAFASYFSSSTVGGVFLLKAVFPVTGDASRIAAFEAQLTNSAGSATTARTSF